MKNRKLFKVSFILLISLIFNCLQSFSQSLGNSPYSSIGLGERFPIGYSENQGMAGVGVASSVVNINPINPALLARNKYTVFSMGMIGQSKGLKTSTEGQNSFAMNLNYVNLSFPVKKHWSMGIAIQPYSYTDFSIKSALKTVPGDTTKYISNLTAKGGINKLSWNNAFEVKEFYFGIESSVLFGQIRRNSDSQLQNDGQFYVVNFTEQQNYNGLYFRLGSAWHHKINKDRYLNIGFAIEPSKKLGAERIRTTQTFTNDGTATSAIDTLANSKLTNKIMLPSDFRIGVSYENTTKFSVFADLNLGKNSQFQNLSGTNEGLKNTVNFGFGGEYFPNFYSLKFLKRAVYRAGFNFGTSPYSHVKTGEQLKDVNLAFGIGLPLKNLSFINIGFTTGRRGTKADGGILENYNKISIGFTLNDVWFVKSKID